VNADLWRPALGRPRGAHRHGRKRGGGRSRRRTIVCSSKPFSSDFAPAYLGRDLPERFGDWMSVYQRFILAFHIVEEAIWVWVESKPLSDKPIGQKRRFRAGFPQRIVE
jgi:hypothetical protein